MLIHLFNKIKPFSLDGHKFFALVAAYFVILGFLSVLLAMAGLFYAFIIQAYLILGLLILALIYFKNKRTISFDKNFLLILSISALAIILFSYFSVPTVFSGRDQGSLSEAAMQLSQKHKLEFSFPAEKEFFRIYGTGKALNFPGFDYTEEGNLITRFPLGYISWLAAYICVFGIKGLIIANAVSLLFFLAAFYLLATHFLKNSAALAAILFILTSFAFSWFFKFTLSENLTLMLLWLGILAFYNFIKNKDRFYLAFSFLNLGFLLFVRIEAVFFLFSALIILFFIAKKQKKSIFEFIGKKIAMLLFIIGILYLFSLAIDFSFFKGLAKDSARSFFQEKNKTFSGNLLAEAFFSIKVLFNYAVLSYLIFGLAGILYLFKKKNFEFLIPFLIVSPSFIYLFDPHISNDHPWMLRRFIFSIIPAAILYGTFFMSKFLKNKILFFSLCSILIAANLLIFIPFISFKPNDNLLPQIKELSANFKDSDLILIDREATGDPFSMMSGPMNFIFQKQAVYFFNPSDLDKINRQNFSNVYLIIPDKNLEFYDKNGLSARLTAQKDYKIEMSVLDVITNSEIDLKTSVILPEKKTLTTSGKIYLLK